MTDDAPMFDRMFAALPGWLLVCCSLAMFAAAVVVPAQLETSRLLHQREAMQQQAAAMEDLKNRYRTFHVALEDHDPTLLRRLAMLHLNVKPVGIRPVPLESLVPPRDPHSWFRNVSDAAPTPETTRSNIPSPASGTSIEALVGDPRTVLAMPVPPFEPPSNRLVRLTTGSMRLLFLCVAGGLMLAGLMWNPPASDDEDAGDAAAVEADDAMQDDLDEPYLLAELDTDADGEEDDPAYP